MLQAGTGKTMMTQIIKEMLNSDAELVGELENNASDQYGLAKLAGRYVVICNDVDSNWTLDATQFTKMVSGMLIRAAWHMHPAPESANATLLMRVSHHLKMSFVA